MTKNLTKNDSSYGETQIVCQLGNAKLYRLPSILTWYKWTKEKSSAIDLNWKTFGLNDFNGEEVFAILQSTRLQVILSSAIFTISYFVWKVIVLAVVFCVGTTHPLAYTTIHIKPMPKLDTHSQVSVCAIEFRNAIVEPWVETGTI